MKTREWLMLGAAGLAAWYLYRKFTVIGDTLTHAGEKAGGAVFDFLHPNAGGSMLTYLVHFSNGVHAIDSDSVDNSGLFMFRGVQFKLVTDAAGNHIATTPVARGIFQ